MPLLISGTGPPIPPAPFPRKRGKGEHDNAEERAALPRLRGRVASPSEPGGGNPTPGHAQTVGRSQAMGVIQPKRSGTFPNWMPVMAS